MKKCRLLKSLKICPTIMWHDDRLQLFFSEISMITKNISSLFLKNLVNFSQIGLFVKCKKVVPYTFARRGVPVGEDTYPEPSACGVGWPVSFLAAFIPPVFPLGTHLLLGEQ